MKRLTAKQRAYLSVAGGFLLTTGGGLASATSVFYLPVTAELGFSQAAFAAYVSIMSWCGAISNPVMGRVFSRFLPKIKQITACAGLFGLLCGVLLSRSSTLPQFYIIGAMMSFLLPFVSSLLGVTIVSRWFDANRSIAISIVAIGTSAGTVIYSQVTSRVTDAFGWRTGYLAFGLLLLVFLIAACLLISPPPENYGLLPLGYAGAKDSSRNEDPSDRVRSTVHSASFWLICFSALSGCVYVLSIQQCIVPFFQKDFSLTPTRAATILSVYSIICAACKPLLGWIYKRLGRSFSILYVGILVCAGALILGLSPVFAASAAGIVVIGIGNMFGTVLLPTLVSDLFGAEIYPAVMGYVNIFFTIGAGIGPLVVGGIYDASGSYRLVFAVIFALCLLNSFLLLLAVRSSGSAPLPKSNSIK